MRNLTRFALLSALAAGLSWAGAQAADTEYAQIQRGHELVNAGDCVACHTTKDGTPFAGGRAIQTPFGIVFSPNITPDQATGIGAWSQDDFYRAMHNGVRPDGALLYPAFPYPYFTKMTRDDVNAVFAYLRTLPAVRNERRANKLPFPLNQRFAMRGWNLLFFEPGTYQPNPHKSAEWNRGAYLVQGPGHCGGCHTPKNALGADETSQALLGGAVQNWFAPKIAGNMHDGTGSWSVDDIAEYLKTGRNKHSGAAGLMAEVVENSTSKLPEADLRAIATYIKDVDGGSTPTAATPDKNVMTAGGAIFADSCSGCHQADGRGVPRMFPPLAHDPNVQQDNPLTVVRVILEGARTAATDKAPTPFAMPAFDWKLTDAQIAAVATYVRNSWGNSAPPVSAATVKDLRDTLRQNLHGHPLGHS